MEDQAFDAGGSEEFQPDSDDLKKKAAAQSMRSAQQTPEDQSRGALHYGEDHEGDTSGSEYRDAEPSKPGQGNGPEGNPSSTADAQSTSAGGSAQDTPTDPSSQVESPGDGSEDSSTARANRSGGTSENARVGGETSAAQAQNAQANGATQPSVAQSADRNDDHDNVANQDEPQENAAPTKISLSSQAIAENQEGAIVGKLSVTDDDAGDSHTYTVSDDRFEVVGGHVKLKDGISLDHEEVQTLTLEVTVKDSAGESYTENFDIAVTDVNEAPTELHLSNAAIAENAEGAVVGTISVSDVDVGDGHSFTVSDDRFEVVDGQVKLKDGISLNHEDVAALTLDVTATDSGGASHTQSFDIAVADMPDVAMATGFHAKYFDMNQSIRSIDDVDWTATATHQELVRDINYKNGRESFWEDGSKDTFGVEITGNIEVTEAGTFNFHIGGDDGVVLYINGQEVVDNDGLHGFRTRSGEVELEPGTHVIEVRYFENYGNAGLKVEWEGPGLDGRELLTPPSLDDLQTVNGMPLSVNLTVDEAQSPEGTVTQSIDGLPTGTVLQSGDMTATVGDDGTVDITDWDTSLLHITPPVDFTGAVDAQVVTTVSMDDGNMAVTTSDLSFDVEAANVSPPTINMQSGFRASYFDVDHSIRNLNEVNWDVDPTKEEIVGEINYANGRDSFWEGGDTDTFGARITGEVTIEEGGTFKFFAGGDDGVVLYVNGVEVIENDGLHSYRTRSGEIELEPGTHDIEVRYFENYGHAGLKLEWEGPGIDGRELVQADHDLTVEENGTLDIGLDTSDIGPDSAVTISGLPADTILISGDDTIVSDGSEIDLSGWDLDLIEMMPPPGFEGTIEAEVTISDTAYNGQVTEATQTFEIEVGDAENATSSGEGDEAMFLAEAQQDDTGDQGWAGEQSEHGDDDGAEDSDDDVMEEPVSENQGSEHSYEMTDTYERNDW